MNAVENKFFTLYKSVDAICRDMFREEHHYNAKCEEVFGLSAYIVIMENEDDSVRAHFPEWNYEHNSLTRLRIIRNRIAHNTDISECNESDIEDLERFHKQILEQTDILARAQRFKKVRSTPKKPSVSRTPQRAARQVEAAYVETINYSAPRRGRKRPLTWLLVLAIAALLLVIITGLYTLMN